MIFTLVLRLKAFDTCDRRAVNLLFSFDEYILDPDRRELRRDGSLVPVEPQVFDLLAFLIRNRDRVVTKDDLLGFVWGGRIISESTLASRINAARRGVGDNGQQQRLIRTIIGKGFRFVAEVEERSGGEPATAFSPPRLSIVVLPFRNLSGDPAQQYFADAITDDLTTDLSRIVNMLVIARNTAFTYRERSVDAKQIGRQLGVRYLLEGSVQRLGGHIRVNAQLIDAETTAVLWAERLDREVGDLFALQDEITSRIAVTLGSELIAAEAARRAENPDALDHILRGRFAASKGSSSENHAQAIRLFERALALDPQSTPARSLLASQLAIRVLDQLSETPAADIARAEELADQALVDSPGSVLAHYAKGNCLRAQGRWQDAIPEYETVIALNPNSMAISDIGWCKFWIGRMEEAAPAYGRAIRLNPRAAGISYFRLGLAHLVSGRIEEAIRSLETARSHLPAHPNTRAILAAAYGLKSEPGRAAAELAEARRLVGDERFASIKRLKAVGYFP